MEEDKGDQWKVSLDGTCFETKRVHDLRLRVGKERGKSYNSILIKYRGILLRYEPLYY